MWAMNELAYLVIALLLSGVASTFVIVRQRQPNSVEAGVQQFSRGLEALEANHQAGPSSYRRRATATRK
jgi:hypothetical protein